MNRTTPAQQHAAHVWAHYYGTPQPMHVPGDPITNDSATQHERMRRAQQHPRLLALARGCGKAWADQVAIDALACPPRWNELTSADCDYIKAQAPLLLKRAGGIGKEMEEEARRAYERRCLTRYREMMRAKY